MDINRSNLNQFQSQLKSPLLNDFDQQPRQPSLLQNNCQNQNQQSLLQSNQFLQIIQNLDQSQIQQLLLILQPKQENTARNDQKLNIEISEELFENENKAEVKIEVGMDQNCQEIKNDQNDQLMQNAQENTQTSQGNFLQLIQSMMQTKNFESSHQDIASIKQIQTQTPVNSIQAHAN